MNAIETAPMVPGTTHSRSRSSRPRELGSGSALAAVSAGGVPSEVRANAVVLGQLVGRLEHVQHVERDAALQAIWRRALRREGAERREVHVWPLLEEPAKQFEINAGRAACRLVDRKQQEGAVELCSSFALGDLLGAAQHRLHGLVQSESPFQLTRVDRPLCHHATVRYFGSVPLEGALNKYPIALPCERGEEWVRRLERSREVFRRSSGAADAAKLHLVCFSRTSRSGVETESQICFARLPAGEFAERRAS